MQISRSPAEGPERPLVSIIGAGLAGCEAAWQLAQSGHAIRLYEMKPQQFSPAHHSPLLGELVCSNSLRGAALTNAVGLLKEELRACRSLFMAAADNAAVPAGGALAVDRDAFAQYLTDKISSHPAIELVRQKVDRIPEEGWVIIAPGPLASAEISEEIRRLTGDEHLYFYDAIAPIIEAESIDFSKAWRASRYGKGGDDYINCPMNREQYLQFISDLRTAEKVQPREFEQLRHFEGCMPIEEMAARGEMTLAFGPMKPVGLPDPRTGREPFAVLQLRQDNRHASLYNMVGFQTKLKHPEQKRIFRTIPGLEQARFARLGSMHRNTFVNAPRCLERTLQLKGHPRIFMAGQITGVEGYVESAACGFLAGLFAAARIAEIEPQLPPPTTALGALLAHLNESDPEGFQPMNVNYGLFPPMSPRPRKRSERRLALAQRALEDLEPWRQRLNATPDP